MERFVSIDQRLHPVLARGQILEAPQRPAANRLVDDDVLAGPERIDVHAEDGPRGVRAVLVGLRARFRAAVVRDEQQHATVEGRRAARCRERDGERSGSPSSACGLWVHAASASAMSAIPISWRCREERNMDFSNEKACESLRAHIRPRSH